MKIGASYLKKQIGRENSEELERIHFNPALLEEAQTIADSLAEACARAIADTNAAIVALKPPWWHFSAPNRPFKKTRAALSGKYRTYSPLGAMQQAG